MKKVTHVARRTTQQHTGIIAQKQTDDGALDDTGADFARHVVGCDRGYRHNRLAKPVRYRHNRLAKPVRYRHNRLAKPILANCGCADGAPELRRYPMPTTV